MEDVLCTRKPMESKTEVMNNANSYCKETKDEYSLSDCKVDSTAMDIDSKASYMSPLTTLSASITQPSKSQEIPKDCLPYRIEQNTSNSNSFVIHFTSAIERFLTFSTSQFFH